MFRFKNALLYAENKDQNSDFCSTWVQNNAFTWTNSDTILFSVIGREKTRARSGGNAADVLKWKALSEFFTTTDLATLTGAAAETVKGWIWAAAKGTSQLFLIWIWPADDPPVGEMELWKNKSAGTGPSVWGGTNHETQKQPWTVDIFLIKKRRVYTLQKWSSYSVFCLVLKYHLNTYTIKYIYLRKIP